MLVEDVTLVREKVIRIQIRWKGGATSSLQRPLPLSAPDLRRTPTAVVEQIRALATEQTDREIAATLNARWLRTGTGKSFARLIVRQIREAYGIPNLAEHLGAAGWLNVRNVAAQLGIHYQTAKRFAAEGLLCARRANDKGDILFAPLSGPLPKAQPGKRFRDRRCYPKLSPRVRKEPQYEA